jgi:hypothetical protein
MARTKLVAHRFAALGHPMIGIVRIAPDDAVEFACIDLEMWSALPDRLAICAAISRPKSSTVMGPSIGYFRGAGGTSTTTLLAVAETT